MSASPDRTLSLMPTRALKRHLSLRVSLQGALSCGMYLLVRRLGSTRSLSIGWAMEDLPRCHLDGLSLWIGGAAFDLTAEEVEKVKAFVPELRVFVKGAAPAVAEGHRVVGCLGEWIDLTTLRDPEVVEKCPVCRAVRRRPRDGGGTTPSVPPAEAP